MVERSVVLDRTYAALAHPIRRQMVEILREGSTRVTDLARPFDVSLAAASKHIRTLESAGIVVRHLVGRDHVLTLRPEPLAAARDWIEMQRTFWESRLDALDQHLRGKRRG